MIQNQSDFTAAFSPNEKIDNKNCLYSANPTCVWANDLCTTESVAFIRAHADPSTAPFFLYLATTTPHVGSLAGTSNSWPTPLEYMSHFNSTAFEDWPQEQRQFAAATWAQDRIVGSVLKELDDQGVANNTLYVRKVRAAVARVVSQGWLVSVCSPPALHLHAPPTANRQSQTPPSVQPLPPA